MKLARDGVGPEIFQSLQGEGISVGVPSVFVRLSLCNLHCHWCDTDYTWNWDDTPYPHAHDADPAYRKFRREDEILTRSPEDVAAHVLAFSARNIIFTGGEPLLQGKELAALAAHLRERASGCRFEIETNGTLVPPPALDALIAQYNVSPKLENSRNTPNEREKSEALRFFAECERAWFKFVVACPEDLTEVSNLCERHGIPRERTILMPQGTDSATLRASAQWLAPLCLEHGYRFGDRLHVHLYGNTRGT